MAHWRTGVVKLAKMLVDAGVRDDLGQIAGDAKYATGRHEWYPEVMMLQFGRIRCDVEEWYSKGTINLRMSRLTREDAVEVLRLLSERGRS